MEKLVFLILSRDKDRFDLLYAGDCQKTEEKSFFVQHPRFKCWSKHSSSDKPLYLAILPLFDSTTQYRENVLSKIVAQYKPVCNAEESEPPKPSYVVRKSDNTDQKIPCACCGAQMKPEKVLEQSTLFRCMGCGLSDTRMND